MLTWLILLASASLSVTLSASTNHSADSVSVFHKPDKVVVVINDRSSQSRLESWMLAWGEKDSLYLESEDGGLRIRCARNAEWARCSMRLLPSESVEILNKEATASVSYENLGRTPVDEFETTFESSNEQFVELKIKKGVVSVYTRKR